MCMAVFIICHGLLYVTHVFVECNIVCRRNLMTKDERIPLVSFTGSTAVSFYIIIRLIFGSSIGSDYRVCNVNHFGMQLSILV